MIDTTLEDGTADLPSAGNWHNSLSLYVPVEQSSLLLDHYFSLVCPISSSFDSIHNPFRSNVSGMMATSRLLFNCVMSMSAAHLYQHEHSSTIPLSFQTEAISEISDELVKVNSMTSTDFGSQADGPHPTISQSTYFVKDELLLGIILLGITSSWHDPSSLGLCHLYGSRQLFRSWLTMNGFDSLDNTQSLTQIQNFLVSSMVYWEVMVSFLIDQQTGSLAYLEPFCDPNLPLFSHLCPLTGVGTPIFIRLAKVGTIVRRRRCLRDLRLLQDDEGRPSMLYSQLLDETRVLEQAILRSRLPSISFIKETDDLRAPPAHLHRLAQCYRLSSLLELYHNFPEIAEDRMELDPAVGVSYDGLDRQAQLVLGIAIEILSILEMIPEDSRTTATQTLVFLIAGGALGQFKTSDLLPTQRTWNQVAARWRRFVQQRLSRTFAAIGLRTIQRVMTLLVEVWSRMDSETTPGSDPSCRDSSFLGQVHWIDVMAEKKLETILG
ncbi:fungal-specific transcription factor domain-containing protein [Dactylonectria macrodidyma]|uniref:Fungal-specific transcription factor domain-containing protein n=1 Tax=Dactylonectria macrodidyma TaxID=307937 RepID=A0A9P9DPV1_9HYPO|nr:fungal-specific transcription factor domain-containing protein [Dactylonectria macrodidyma]